MDIGIPNFDFFSIIEQCGFPIALALICGWFIMQAISLVLGSVVKSIKKITGLIKSMDGRVRQMNTDVLELDQLISKSLYVDPLPKKVHLEVHQVMNNNGAPPLVKEEPKKNMLEKLKDVVDTNKDGKLNLDDLKDAAKSLAKEGINKI